MKQRLFIFGYYGWKNTGDDAMIYALLQEVYSMNPYSKFAVLSPIPIIVPPEVEGIVKYVKPSIFSVWKEILKASIFVIGGGTHLSDYGNEMKALKNLLRIFLLVLYAKILCKKVYILGNGIGPLQTRFGRFLARATCCLADYITVRDKTSYKFLIEWDLIDKASLAFDLSVLISSGRNGINIQKDIEKKKILGISVTPVFKIYYRSKEKDFIVVNEISKHVNDWLKREPNSEVRLFVFHGDSKDDDTSITRLLYKKLYPSSRIKIVPYEPNPQKMITQVGQCKYFIGMKYHSLVFAYVNRIPLLVIKYHPKCYAFAEEIGLKKNAILSLEEILDGQFGKHFNNLLEYPNNFIPILPVDIAKKRAKNGLLDAKAWRN